MNISHSVVPIRQPNLYDCWAAATAMVLGLGGQRGIDEVKRRATGILLNPNGSIRSRSVPALARSFNLQVINLVSPPQLLTSAILQRALGSSCAAAFGRYVYPGAPDSTDHALLFYALSGSDADPTVSFVDPYTGQRHHCLVSRINDSLGCVDYLLHR